VPAPAATETGPVQLGIAILDRNNLSASVLEAVLRDLPKVTRVLRYENGDAVLRAFESGEANALMINLFSVGDALKVITATRDRFQHIPICLVGTNDQLSTFPDVPAEFKKRFSHYFRLTIDDPPDLMRSNAGVLVGHLSSYLLSRAAKVRLRDLRELIAQNPSTLQNLPEGAERKIQETVELAERALAVRDEVGPSQYVIPGFAGSDVQVIIKTTLEGASFGLKRTANVNIGILIVGALLVIASFVVAVSSAGDWKAVSFGGFGISGIVAALITNPLKSIGLGARQLVQIQVAYLGFLNQVAMLNRLPADRNSQSLIEQSKQLSDATTTILAALEKHFG